MEQHLSERVLERQKNRLQRAIQRLQQRSRQYSLIRLAVIAIGIPCIYLASLPGIAFAWIAGSTVVILFLLVALMHDRVEKSVRRHEVWHYLTSLQSARIQREWDGLPLPHDDTVDYRHPFAADLGITGRRSLQHLIDTTTSIGGSTRLRDWLLHPLSHPQAIEARQELVKELIPRTLFRKRLALNGLLIARKRWNADALFAWLDESAPRTPMMAVILPLAVLAMINIGSFVLSITTGAAPLWTLTLPLYIVLHSIAYTIFFTKLHGFAASATNLKYALERMQHVLLFVEESAHTQHGALARELGIFHRRGSRPSDAVRSLTRIARGAALQNNLIAWMLLNILMPWNFFFYDRLNRYREHLREVLPVWLDRVYELEALSALAEFAALNPDTSFPEIVTENNRHSIEARSLGHPFLRAQQRVSNDFTIDHRGMVALLSGSNMSGKSTFLRTLGVNTVLALAGSAVTAASLRTVPLRLFTSMAVSDSVVDGVSFFYAEVQRLKALLTEARTPHQLPLLFLIDEIFRGTNNRERLIGGRSYIRALARTDAFGLVSTHDLELVQLAAENNNIVNYHFREDVVDGFMVFDYKLHMGPCPTTNALKIMAMEGLPVEFPADTKV